MVQDFLQRFVYNSDLYSYDVIDASLALKTLPKKLSDINIDSVKLIDFKQI